VISELGTPASPFREVTLLSSATRALVNAMRAERVSRLVAITGIGAERYKQRGLERTSRVSGKRNAATYRPRHLFGVALNVRLAQQQ
jgi:hypothetical protein